MSEQSQELDVYSYAASKGAQYKTGGIGKEWVARCVNPQCSSRNDAFSVQPAGKLTGRWAGRGAWMCRKCWDPSEIVTVRGTRRKRGWGNILDLVMLCEGMEYIKALRFIEEYEGVVIPLEQRPKLREKKTDEQWFREASEYLSNARYAGQEEQELVLNYLALRGLTIETAQRLGFGYSLDPVPLDDGSFRKIPFLVIPWYKDENTLYRKINRRNLHNPLPVDESKYRLRAECDRDMLYLGESLLREKRPTFLVESELDAATILQEAGNLVHVVATGSVDHGKSPVSEMRLRRQPFVFISFDADESGEKASAYWQSKLDRCIRYKPLLHDANAMHVKGLSVRAWVEAGLAYYCASPIRPVLSVEAFYHAFCSRPGYHLRLRDDGQIGIGVPGSVSDEEFERIQEEVDSYGDELYCYLQQAPNEKQVSA